MKIVSVGSQYPDALNIPPNKGALSLQSGHTELILNYQNPSPKEIEAVQRGKGRFWLGYEKGLIILSCRFSDPTNGQTITEGEYFVHVGLWDKAGLGCSIDEWTDGQHMLFNLALLDHDTQIVKALRVFTFGPRFLAEFQRLIAKQRAENSDPSDMQSRANEVMAKYTVKKLIQRAICYCNLGEDAGGKAA